MSNKTKHYTLNDDQREMVRLAMPYAKFLATSYVRPGIEMDDLCQQAYIGLCDAADNYRPDSKASFITFAKLHVTESIELFIRHYGPGRLLSRMPADAYVDTVPIDNPDDDENENPSLQELIPDNSNIDPFVETEIVTHNDSLAKALLSILEPDERELVIAFFSDGNSHSTEPIWRRFNMGKTAFYARLHTAVIKMKTLAQQLNIQPLS